MITNQTENDLLQIEAETFEILDLPDVGQDLAMALMDEAAAACSYSCSCSSCCSCSTSSCCSTSSSTSSCG
jgi:hypothetical protein